MFSGSKQFRLFHKNIKMFHNKDIFCIIITTESVISAKLVFFVEKCHTDAIFFSTQEVSLKEIFSLHPSYRIHNSKKFVHFLRRRILETRNFYLIFLTTLRGFFHINFLGVITTEPIIVQT